MRPAPGDQQRIRLLYIPVRRTRGLPGGKQPLAVLAYDHEVDRGAAFVCQGRMGGVIQAEGADPVVEIELLAQVDLRRHLDAVGPAHLRQAHRPQEDRVAGAAALDHVRWQRIAVAPVLGRPGGELLGREAYPVEHALDSVQHGEAGGRHFGTDAVTRKDGDVVGCHA
jgi:hypothetical protein